MAQALDFTTVPWRNRFRCLPFLPPQKKKDKGCSTSNVNAHWYSIYIVKVFSTKLFERDRRDEGARK